MIFQGFAFNSVNEDVGPQRLKCHVQICHDDIEDSPCSTGCFEQTTTTTATTTTTTTTASMVFCDPSTISDSQYCYTIPDGYAYFDEYDYSYYYHGSEEITTGATITMSRTCATDYHRPGTCYSDGICFSNRGCAYYETLVGVTPRCHWMSANDLLLNAAPTENGYITPLNCPGCGCTEDDIITLDERKSGTRTMRGADHA